MGSDLTQLRMEAMKEGKIFKLYASQFEQYGRTWEENWRGKPLINTTEPTNVKQVAALSVNDYGKDPERAKAQSPFFGPSIFSDGHIWKEARGLVKPIFARAEISDMDHLASFWIVLWTSFRMMGFLDVSMDFIFGKSLNSLEPEVPKECTEFTQAFNEAQKWVTKRREAGWLQFRLYQYNENKEWKNAYTKVHKFVDQQVARALQQSTNAKREPDFPAIRRRYVLGVFNPARDTTSIAVGNTLFQLARHPHIWTKLRETSLEIDEPLTFEKLKSLVEFRYVIQETIRVCRPAARVWRMAIRDTILPLGGGPDQKSPVFVAQGTPVVLGTWSMNHDKGIWGDDVEVFNPDRWIGRRGQEAWEFVPFLGGPRICPAQQQVLTYSIYLLVRLTQRYESIENCDTVFEYLESFRLGFESRNGVKVAFKSP
ncbi:hypothetical protein EAF04_000630 [Stromatinia cepivora]|nr:hypothetical protein EAF04_000630 [Stromatinia cepivora]